MGRCRCDPVTVSGCQCAFESSNDVETTGAGSTGNPFISSVILDPSPDNILSTGIDGLFAGVPEEILNPPRGLLRMDSQDVPPDELTVITWDIISYDSDNMHSGGGNIICVTSGVYHFSSDMFVEAGGGGQREYALRKNGSALIAVEQESSPGTGAGSAYSIGGDTELGAGDVVTATFYHTSEDTLDVGTGRISWHRVGPTA